MTDNEPECRIAARHIILQNFRDNIEPKIQLEIKRFSPAHDIWAQATEALRLWAEDAPAETNRYHKIEFIVIYRDGSVYNSCYLLQRRHADDPAHPPDLSRQMLLCLETFAGLRRPAHLSEDEYTVFLHTFGRASRETHERLLAGYEIPCLGAEFVTPAASIGSPQVYLPINDISDSSQPA